MQRSKKNPTHTFLCGSQPGANYRDWTTVCCVPAQKPHTIRCGTTWKTWNKRWAGGSWPLVYSSCDPLDKIRLQFSSQTNELKSDSFTKWCTVLKTGKAAYSHFPDAWTRVLQGGLQYKQACGMCYWSGGASNLSWRTAVDKKKIKLRPDFIFGPVQAHKWFHRQQKITTRLFSVAWECQILLSAAQLFSLLINLTMLYIFWKKQ